ncbi:unnamed protein product [Schistosoma margrebowiei]|uniref:Uncharacterized protein n=1 Tax=Schistosoma margrebowiei TaxID=48269 RepID=A0A183N203_9TREM|nr:unnamed protein product [Schistosoma margrebowiei]
MYWNNASPIEVSKNLQSNDDIDDPNSKYGRKRSSSESDAQVQDVDDDSNNHSSEEHTTSNSPTQPGQRRRRRSSTYALLQMNLSFRSKYCHCQSGFWVRAVNVKCMINYMVPMSFQTLLNEFTSIAAKIVAVYFKRVQTMRHEFIEGEYIRCYDNGMMHVVDTSRA